MATRKQATKSVGAKVRRNRKRRQVNKPPQSRNTGLGWTQMSGMQSLPKKRRSRRPGRTTRNAALAGKGSTRNSSSNRREWVISEDEYIGAVTVANQPNFNNVSYPVNPGQVTSFPWLSTVASRFEKYHFEFLEFYYKREVSEFATNGQVGKVMLSFDADASDAPPGTKTQIEATEPHRDGMPCENIRLVIPPKMFNKFNDGYFIRPAGLPGAADIKTYDIGNLNIATQGILNNVEIGELHVRYRVKLMIPVIENAGAPANNSVAQLIESPGISPATTVYADVPFNDTTAADGYINGLNVNLNGGSGQLILPAGNYLIDVTLKFVASGSATNFNLNTYKNDTLLLPAASQPELAFVAAQVTSGELSQTFYMSSNGTDYVAVQAMATYSTGTITISGNLRITAI